jgi:hypothetical protein
MDYRRSSFCPAQACVEARLLTDGNIAVRDSKDVDKDPHVFTPAEWLAFLQGVKNGEFDFDSPVS